MGEELDMNVMIEKLKESLQDAINTRNRKRLINKKPTIIASNCTGGFLYHWLGLQFRSPFINLYMSPDDFIMAMEHFDEFISTPIAEKPDSEYEYPIGVGAFDTLIHFMHYENFDEAVYCWNKRLKRIDKENMCVLLSNWGGYNIEQLKRFDKLPFKYKIAFTDTELPELASVFCLKGYSCKNGNIYATQNVLGRRYIDQFDYVGFLNKMIEK